LLLFFSFQGPRLCLQRLLLTTLMGVKGNSPELTFESSLVHTRREKGRGELREEREATEIKWERDNERGERDNERGEREKRGYREKVFFKLSPKKFSFVKFVQSMKIWGKNNNKLEGNIYFPSFALQTQTEKDFLNGSNINPFKQLLMSFKRAIFYFKSCWININTYLNKNLQSF